MTGVTGLSYSTVNKFVRIMVTVGLILFFLFSGTRQLVRLSFNSLLSQGVSYYLDQQTADFSSLESSHFRLKYSEVDEDLAETILDTAETLYEKVRYSMDYQAEGKILLVLYPDDEGMKSSLGLGDQSAVGVYWAGTIRLLSPRAWPGSGSEQEELLARFNRENPLSHELVHYCVDKMTGGNFTRWFSEGLAQYMEREITGFVLDEPNPQAKKQLYVFSALDKNFDKQPDQVLAYWQSLQAVEYLVNRDGNAKILALLDLLDKGLPFEKAFQTTYGFNTNVLEEELKKRI